MTRFFAVIVSQRSGQQPEANDTTLVAEGHVEALRQLAAQLEPDPQLELLSIATVSERKADQLENAAKN